MSEARPRLSIGLPVFNGERYLAAAIGSILDSSFRDWELIISDNASIDGTQALAQSFAQQDARIRYLRNATNIGALPNFNQVARAARGEYFKWLAYDDLCGPDMLARCVEVLDRDSTIVLCSARFVEIDQHGRPLGEQPYRLDLTSTLPHIRLGRLMHTPMGHPLMFGVIRASVLRRTGLLATYHGSDRALIAELTLHGRLWEIPEVLWSSRDHPDRSPYVRTTQAGWDPGRRRRAPLHFAIAANMARIIATAPISRMERVRCAGELIATLVGRSRELGPIFVHELLDAGRGAMRRRPR